MLRCRQPQPAIRVNAHMRRHISCKSRQHFFPRPPTKPRHAHGPQPGCAPQHICLNRLGTDRHEHRGELWTTVRCSRPTLRVPQSSRPFSAFDVTMTKPSLTTNCEGKRHSCRPMTPIPASSKVLASRACLAGILRPFASLFSPRAIVGTFNVALLKDHISFGSSATKSESLSSSKMFSTLHTSVASQHMSKLLQPGLLENSSPIPQAPYWSLAHCSHSWPLRPRSQASHSAAPLCDFSHGSFQHLQQRSHSHSATDA